MFCNTASGTTGGTSEIDIDQVSSPTSDWWDKTFDGKGGGYTGDDLRFARFPFPTHACAMHPQALRPAASPITVKLNSKPEPTNSK